MTPERAAMREIAQRLKTGEGLYQSIMSVYPSPSPRWYEDVQQIADYVLAIAAPLLVTCRECGGRGRWLDDAGPEELLISCTACHGSGSVEREDIASIRKRFEDAPHGELCRAKFADCLTCGATSFVHLPTERCCVGQKLIQRPCDCWKSTFGLDALLDLIAAQAREIERLKGKANE